MNSVEPLGKGVENNVVPSGKYCVKASFSVLPSSESVHCALRSVRPFSLRTTSQLLGPFTVMEKVVPLRAGWSVPSATIVSTWPGPKVRAYLFSPTASTFISSVSLLLEGFTFHLPMKGSLAAHNVPIARQTTGSDRRLRSSIRIPESYPQARPPAMGNVVSSCENGVNLPDHGAISVWIFPRCLADARQHR